MEFAKLRDNLEIDLSGAIYARHSQGKDFDCESSWRQNDIKNIMKYHSLGQIDFIVSRTGETLLLLRDGDLARLEALWLRLRGAA